MDHEQPWGSGDTDNAPLYRDDHFRFDVYPIDAAGKRIPQDQPWLAQDGNYKLKWELQYSGDNSEIIRIGFSYPRSCDAMKIPGCLEGSPQYSVSRTIDGVFPRSLTQDQKARGAKVFAGTVSGGVQEAGVVQILASGNPVERLLPETITLTYGDQKVVRTLYLSYTPKTRVASVRLLIGPGRDVPLTPPGDGSQTLPHDVQETLRIVPDNLLELATAGVGVCIRVHVSDDFEDWYSTDITPTDAWDSESRTIRVCANTGSYRPDEVILTRKAGTPAGRMPNTVLTIPDLSTLEAMQRDASFFKSTSGVPIPTEAWSYAALSAVIDLYRPSRPSLTNYVLREPNVGTASAYKNPRHNYGRLLGSQDSVLTHADDGSLRIRHPDRLAKDTRPCSSSSNPWCFSSLTSAEDERLLREVFLASDLRASWTLSAQRSDGRDRQNIPPSVSRSPLIEEFRTSRHPEHIGEVEQLPIAGVVYGSGKFEENTDITYAITGETIAGAIVEIATVERGQAFLFPENTEFRNIEVTPSREFTYAKSTEDGGILTENMSLGLITEIKPWVQEVNSSTYAPYKPKVLLSNTAKFEGRGYNVNMSIPGLEDDLRLRESKVTVLDRYATRECRSVYLNKPEKVYLRPDDATYTVQIDVPDTFDFTPTASVLSKEVNVPEQGTIRWTVQSANTVVGEVCNTPVSPVGNTSIAIRAVYDATYRYGGVDIGLEQTRAYSEEDRALLSGLAENGVTFQSPKPLVASTTITFTIGAGDGVFIIKQAAQPTGFEGYDPGMAVTVTQLNQAPQTGLQVIDMLPTEGADHKLSVESSGQFASRASTATLRLTGPIEQAERNAVWREDYDVYYTTDPLTNDTQADHFSTYTWVRAPEITDWNTVTGWKLVAKPHVVLESGESLRIFLPTGTTTQRPGAATAMNTAAMRTDQVKFLESNTASAAISRDTTIVVPKVTGACELPRDTIAKAVISDAYNPLERVDACEGLWLPGARFTVTTQKWPLSFTDRGGIHIRNMSVNKDVTSLVIKEAVSPEGYVAARDRTYSAEEIKERTVYLDAAGNVTDTATTASKVVIVLDPVVNRQPPVIPIINVPLPVTGKQGLAITLGIAAAAIGALIWLRRRH